MSQIRKKWDGVWNMNFSGEEEDVDFEIKNSEHTSVALLSHLSFAL